MHFATTANHAFTTKDAPGSTEQNDSDANPDGYTDKLVLTPGEAVPTGAGFILPATISNRVWEDLNSDGVQDVGEPGVPNVEVKLFKDNSSNASPDALLAATNTNNEGFYSFGNLNAFITYRVQFTLISDHAFTIKDVITATEATDSDAYPNGYTDAIVLTPGANSPTGAGLIASADACTIGDRVWYDLDGNGIQDVGEGNVSGINVELYADSACSANFIGSTTTDSNGLYGFDTLPLGNYCLVFSEIPGSWFVSPNNQGDDTIDSDPNPLSGNFATLPILQQNMVCKDNTKDMGLWAAGTITQKAWCENSGNSTFDPSNGDTALANVDMSLYKDTDCNVTADGAAIQTLATDANGDVLFNNLPVAFTEIAGQRTCYLLQVDTADPDLGSCTSLPSGGTTSIELSTDRVNTNTQYVTGGGFALIAP